MLVIALGCAASLECGPGTLEADRLCLPIETDIDVETEVDTDPGTDGDTDADTDTDTATPPIDVYLLAGQSNMDGYGYLSGLPPEWQTSDPAIPLFWSGWWEFRGLGPASYGGPWNMGPEVALGHGLAEGGHEIALVKHAVGGTDLAVFWNPGTTNTDPRVGEGWAGLLLTMQTAALALDTDGRPWRWAGFAWMQGESDALYEPYALAYEDNLRQLVARVREETKQPALPFVIGKITADPVWTYHDVVRDAEAAVAAADPNVLVVETDDLLRNPQDIYHYDGIGQRVLGDRFARAFLAGTDVGAGTNAPTPAMVVTSWAYGDDRTGTCGWSFHLDVPATITDIGSFNPTNYRSVSSDVGIWDADKNLVLRANVPSFFDFPATWRGGFWYIAVDPITLPAGDYRIAQVEWAEDYDPYATNAVGTMAEGFEFGEGVRLDSYWLAYPADGSAGDGLSFVGPNLLFVP